GVEADFGATRLEPDVLSQTDRGVTHGALERVEQQTRGEKPQSFGRGPQLAQLAIRLRYTRGDPALKDERAAGDLLRGGAHRRRRAAAVGRREPLGELPREPPELVEGANGTSYRRKTDVHLGNPVEDGIHFLDVRAQGPKRVVRCRLRRRRRLRFG